ncbi:MAG: membrane-anchored protein YejM (alkaline phosphatase superfamily) [Planctomycetota bacterium]|jgi:membrane-anchored protein YejM (alkaline phosphatase superfamily)
MQQPRILGFEAWAMWAPLHLRVSILRRPEFYRLSPQTSLLALSVAALALASCGGESTQVEEEVPPSLILISLDTLRYDHCGFNGYERDTTPFLDKLAKESIVFDRVYTTMSWTLIAHMSMLTGLYPNQHGVFSADVALTNEFPTLAERLHREGYLNSGVYANGWVGDRYGFNRGFDSYERAFSIEKADAFVRASMKAVRPGFPYFQFIHLFDIHSASFHLPGSTIYDPPAPFDSLFVEDAKERLAGIDALEWWTEPVTPTPEQHEAVVALYDGGIRHVDSVLEAWFTDWEERGLLDNTIVVITADHGEGLRQRLEHYGGHGGLKEEGLRVPLLIRLPGGERGGERIDELMSLIDIVPTVLDIAGLPGDDRLPGRSAMGPPRAEDEWVFVARDSVSAAISRDQKIIYAGPIVRSLFDLAKDPGELEPFTFRSGRKKFSAIVEPILDHALVQLGTYYQPGEALNIDELDEQAKSDLRGLGYAGEVDDQ